MADIPPSSTLGAPEQKEEVIFGPLLERYRTDQDICVVYELGRGFEAGAWDWVGLYRTEAAHSSHYLAFEWATNKQMGQRNTDNPRVREVKFQAKYIHVGGSDNQHYCFLYVNHGEVKGSSNRFLITNNSSPPTDNRPTTGNHPTNTDNRFTTDNRPTTDNHFTTDNCSTTGNRFTTDNRPHTQLDQIKDNNRTDVQALNQVEDSNRQPAKERSNCSIERAESDTSEGSQKAESLDGYELVGLHPSDMVLRDLPSRKNSDEFHLTESAKYLHDGLTLTGSFSNGANGGLDILKILDLLDSQEAFDSVDPTTDEDQHLKKPASCQEVRVDQPARNNWVGNDDLTLQTHRDTPAGGQKVENIEVNKEFQDGRPLPQGTPDVEQRGSETAVKTFPPEPREEERKQDGRQSHQVKASGSRDKKHRTTDKLASTDCNNNPQTSVVPYTAAGSLVPVYNAFSQSHRVHQDFLLAPYPTVSRCRGCQRRKQEVRKARARASDNACKYGQVQRECESLRATLDNKTSLLQKLTDRVRYLTRDNIQLNLTTKSLTDARNKMAAMSRECGRLAFELRLSECRGERLEAETVALHERKQRMMCELEIAERGQESLAAELECLRSEYQTLERHLDDVMYTLSLQGYTSMTDSKGNCIDLTKISGKLIDLEGWNFAGSKRTEKCLQRVRAQEVEKQRLEETMKLLTGENARLIEELKVKDNTIARQAEQLQLLSDQNTSLESEVSELGERLKEAETLAKESRQRVLNERKNTSQILRKHQEQVNDLEKNMSCLQDLVEANVTKKKPATGHPNRTVSIQTSSSRLTGPAACSQSASTSCQVTSRPRHPVMGRGVQCGSDSRNRGVNSGKQSPGPGILKDTLSGALSRPAVTFDKVSEVIPVSRDRAGGQCHTDLVQTKVETGSGSAGRNAKKETVRKPARKFLIEYISRGKRNGKGGKRSATNAPGKAIQVNDLSCYHCGLAFLPGTNPNHIQRHIESHTYTL